MLSKKPGALAGSSALEQRRAQGRWPASFDRLWEELKKRRGKQEGTRAMIDLLLLGRTHGYDALREAIEKSVAMGCMDVSAVVLLLQGRREVRPPLEPVEIGELSRYDRPQPTLADYDQLLRKWPEAEVMHHPFCVRDRNTNLGRSTFRAEHSDLRFPTLACCHNRIAARFG